ncbi:NAD(P)-binding domain-containing protein [Paenibacillus koleovorans]|uniref:NAD(P)-binding domain-containing protein n=1 Tax=Paenibacillus koleovorans TaxID=121608 RepID=UPI000FD76C96|nr:NAD(P)-binding domain-containing protein [Paenibacillus koleovorans]
MKSIGFIGLGTMGAPMAKNLLRKGFPVTVYNRSLEKAEDLVALGATVSTTPAEAARDADVLITMLSNDTAIRQVFYDAYGVLEGLHSGMTIIDCSTISPHTSRTLYAELGEQGAFFLDAPVTGSKPAAMDGTLLFMVGGDEDVLASQDDVFRAMGSQVIYMGPAGSGSYAKLAHNTMVGINALGFIEGMALAAKANIHMEKFLAIVLAGSACSRQAELKGEKILDRNFDVQFSMQLMHKDLRIATQLTDLLQLTTPMLGMAKNMFEMGLSKGLGEQDLSAVVQVYEDWMGAPIQRSKVESNIEAILQAESSFVDRRKSIRLMMDIPLLLSVYQWEQEGAFSGQNIAGTLFDISESGLHIASSFPLAQDMFIVIHFPQEADLPPITGRIIRIQPDEDTFHYGCMLSGLPPSTRIKLEEYIRKQLQPKEEQVEQAELAESEASE